MGSSLNPAGIKKPSPGFILKADASLAPLNNAQIEVRAMSGARAEPFSAFPSRLFRAACQSGGSPARNDAFRGLCDSVDLFEREKAPVQTTAGWFTVGRPTRRFQTFFFFFCFAFVPFPRSRASGSRPSPTLTVHEIYEFAAPPSLAPVAHQLYWPDDGMWYKAEVVSLNQRARTAKVLYATGDVETLSVDEIAAEGHLNVCA